MSNQTPEEQNNREVLLSRLYFDHLKSSEKLVMNATSTKPLPALTASLVNRLVQKLNSWEKREENIEKYHIN